MHKFEFEFSLLPVPVVVPPECDGDVRLPLIYRPPEYERGVFGPGGEGPGEGFQHESLVLKLGAPVGKTGNNTLSF